MVDNGLPNPSPQIEAAVAMEKRFSGIDQRVLLLEQKLEGRLANIETSMGALANEKKNQNGRVGKLEELYEHIKEIVNNIVQEGRVEEAFIHGRASMRKTDLAIVAGLATFLATAVGLIIRFIP